jgi:hypothetical protein
VHQLDRHDLAVALAEHAEARSVLRVAPPGDDEVAGGIGSTTDAKKARLIAASTRPACSTGYHRAFQAAAAGAASTALTPIL